MLPYGAFLPSFTDEWGFMLCFKNARVPSDLRDCVMGINVDEELSALGLGGDALTWCVMSLPPPLPPQLPLSLSLPPPLPPPLLSRVPR